MVPVKVANLPPKFEISLLSSIIAGIITVIAMMGIFRRIDLAGLIFMVVGTFVFVMLSATSLNVLLDRSKPVTRTILVNNIDIKPASRNRGESYYALVQSWWDHTHYLPVNIPKKIYQQITPKVTYLDITVGEGAFGIPYFADIAISSETTGPPPGLIEFTE